jgi:glyoxylase I family protein
MKFIAIHHVSLIVKDTERAVAFYSRVLGLPVCTDRPELGFPGAWLQVAENQQIHLLEVPNPYEDVEMPVHGGRDRHAAFRIQGVDELAARLERAGLAFTLSRSGRKALFCRDPDGNTLEFIEVPQAHQ